jgi:hypothetical protein
MRIGVISEGHADRAVIANLLIGLKNLDSNDIKSIRPDYSKDETDKVNSHAKTAFSTWSIVKEECEKRTSIEQFLSIEDQFVVIHIDTAEAEDYGIIRPDKNDHDYCSKLRTLVMEKIEEWIKPPKIDALLHAIAIEEIDAWVLTIYDKNDSSKSAKPKEKLSFILGKKGIESTSKFDNYFKLSADFRKLKKISQGRYLDYNYSLKAFYEEVKLKVG